MSTKRNIPAKERPDKRCPKCGKTYPRTTQYFYRHKKRYDGLQARCKWCFDEAQKEPRSKPHRVEQHRAYQRQRRTRRETVN